MFGGFGRGNKQLLALKMRMWYHHGKEDDSNGSQRHASETADRTRLSQDALAEKLFVTRQAVSRWERGDTLPNTETLKLLSKLYDVSINTLLGSPRTLICQCCGMPLDDTTISREPGGAFNEDYCKWCYTDGKFAYNSLEELLAFLVPYMSNDAWPPEQVRAYLADMLPKLKHWAK